MDLPAEFQDGIKQSKIFRIDWAKILDMTLTTWCYLQFDAKASKEYVYKLLCQKIRNKYNLEVTNGVEQLLPITKVYESASISVSARYSEYNRRRLKNENQ